MLRKLYEKSEIGFAVGWIVLYVLVMGNLEAAFGAGSVYSAIGMLVIAGSLAIWIVRNGLQEKFGFRSAENAGKLLYFIPLFLLGTVNLWSGMKMNYDALHQMFAVMTMALSGLAEEMIFRGLLYRAIEPEGVKKAAVISSVTFGAGHIINLLTGAGTPETFLQMLYAIAIGLALVMVFRKSGSLYPCILTHSLINVTAEFSCTTSAGMMYVQVLFLLAVSLGYVLYLRKV